LNGTRSHGLFDDGGLLGYECFDLYTGEGNRNGPPGSSVSFVRKGVEPFNLQQAAATSPQNEARKRFWRIRPNGTSAKNWNLPPTLRVEEKATAFNLNG